MNRHRQEVFTEKEAAEYLRVSQRYIRLLVEEGELAVVRDGLKFTRFLRSDLLDYMRRHRTGPLPQAEDMAALKAYRRETEDWQNVYSALMGDDRGPSLMSILHTCFPGDEAQGLATTLRDLEWPELVQASRTWVDTLSAIEELGTLTALVRAVERLVPICETLVGQLSKTASNTRDFQEGVCEREEQERIHKKLHWSDTLTPCCHAPWRLPLLEEGDWEVARVCTRCDRIWTLGELREALASIEFGS